MAKKKNDIDDFDFDNLDFDEIQFPGEEKDNKGKNDRNPVSSLKNSFARGAREQFTKPQTIRRFASAALPKEYKSFFDAADTFKQEGSELYNSAVKELKPALPQLKRATRSVLPRVRRYLPDRLAKKLDDLTEDRPSYSQRSQGEEDDETIAGNLGEIFKIQMEANAQQREEDAAERRIRQRISDNRQVSVVKQLSAIRGGMERLTAYQDQITAKYQQKSLELQYRHYFATRDILKQIVENSIRDKEHQEALLKNTSLPEYAKIKLSEVNHQLLRDRLLGRIQGAMGSALSRMGKRLVSNAKGAIQGAVGGFAEGVQMAGDTREMMSEMGISPTQMFGEQMGNMFAGAMGQKLGEFFAPTLKKMPGVAKAGSRAAYMLNTAGEQLRNAGRKYEDDTGIKGFFARMLVDAFPTLGRGDSRVGDSPLLGADKPAQYDNLSRRSLVEIIPGYLSRIHQEIASLRTGQPVDRITFNMDRGVFTDYKTAKKDVRRLTMDGNAVLNTREEMDKFINELAGNKRLDPAFAKRLRAQLYDDTVNGRQFTLERYTSDTEQLRHLSDTDKRKFLETFGDQFKTKTGRPDYARLNTVARKFGSLHSVAIDPSEIIRARVEQGQLQEMMDLGYVRLDPDSGEMIIDRDAIDREVLDSDVTLTPGQRDARDAMKAKQERSAREARVRARMVKRKAKQAYGKVKGKVGAFAEAHISPETRDSAKQAFDSMNEARRGAVDTVSDYAGAASDVLRDTAAGQGFRAARVGAKRMLRKFGRGFSRGGWTGPGGKFEEVGTVHGDEIVWSQENIAQAGGKDTVEALRRQGLKGLRKMARRARRGKKQAKDVLNAIDGIAQAIYVAGREEPVLDPIKLQAGLYHDVRTGKPLKTINDIRGPVADETGTVVLSSEMIARDLYDAAGRKLDGLTKRARDGALALRKQAQDRVAKEGGWSAIGGKLRKRVSDKLSSAKKKASDLYSEYGVEAKIEAAKLQAGEYRDQATGAVLKKLEDIRGPVVDSTGKIVLSAKDLSGKLFDQDGKTLNEIGQKARAGIGRVGRGLQGFGAGLFGARAPSSATDVAGSGVSADYETQSLEQGAAQIELLGGILEAVASGAMGGSEAGTPGRPGLLRRGLGLLGRGTRGAAGLYGRYLKTVFGGMWGAGKTVVGGIGALANSGTSGAIGGIRNALTDIYVEGRKEPALLAHKLRNGDYLDRKTGKPVRSIRDIKGAVLNELGDVVLTEEEYARGLFNSRGRKIVGAITGAAGALVRGYANFLGGSWSLMFAGMNRALKMATNIVRGSDENKPADIYVEGEMDQPRLRAVLMRSGKYRLLKAGKPGKVITGWKDVTGAVVDQDGNIVLSEEDYAKGIVNWMGRPFGGLKRGLGRLAGGLLNGATGLVGAVGKAYFGVAKALVGVTGDAASWGIRSIGRLFGAFNPKHIVETDSKIVHFLQSIYNVLDQRLPATKRIRKGSFEDRMAEEAEKDKQRKDAKEKSEAEKVAKSGGMFGAMSRWLKERLDKDDEDEEDEDGGDTTIVAGGGGGDDPKQSRRDRAKQRLKDRKRAKRRKGKLGALFRAKDAVGGKLSRFKPKGKGRLGRFASRFRPRGAGVGGLATGLAMGVGGDWLLDKTLGTKGAARGAADTALNVAGTASMLGMVPGVGAAVGGAASAVGGAASAIGSGAAAIGSGILGVVGAPVVLGALAVGGLAYGGYKVFKKLKYGKSGPMRAYRLMQYGIDPTDTSQAEPVVKLEAMLADRVRNSGGQAEIDVKGLDAEAIQEMFDLDDGMFTRNETTARRRYEWVQWFQQRFKPIFCTWVTTLKSFNKPMDLQEIDDKLPGSLKLKLLDRVKSFSGLYALRAKPIHDEDVIIDGNVIAQAETAARDAATAEAKKEKPEEAKGDVKAPDAVTGKKPETATTATGAKTAAAASATAATAAKPVTATVNSARGSGNLPVSAVASAGAVSVSVGKAVSTSGVTALDAVRYRTYGLTELTGDRVAAVRDLEARIFSQLTIDQSGAAKYTGNINELLQQTAGSFGVSLTNSSDVGRWMTWMNERVLPTALAYAGAVRKASPTAALTDAERVLKPEQRLTVARETVAARNASGSAVWSVYGSPWFDGESLNSDSNSTYASILVLQQAIRKQKPVSEPAVAGQKGQQAKEQAKKDVQNGTAAGNDSWVDRAKSTLSNIWQKTKSALANPGLALATAVGKSAEAVREGVSSAYTKLSGFFGGGEAPKLKGTAAQREKLLITEAIKAGITDPTELASFMAQVAHESARFSTFSEGYKYSPGRAVQVFPKYIKSVAHAQQLIAENGPGAILEAAYGPSSGKKGRELGNVNPGDGFKYRGRGAIQLTGRANYEAFAKASGIDVVNNPDLVATDPMVAAKASIWWWMSRKGRGIRQKAAAGDVKGVTRIVNGGENGLSDRESLFAGYAKKFQGQSIEQIQNAAAEGSAELAKTSANSVQSGSPRTGGAATTAATPAAAAATGATPAKTTSSAPAAAPATPKAPAAPKPVASAPVSSLPVPSINDSQSTQAVAARANPTAPAVMAQQSTRVEQAAAIDMRGRQANDSNRQIDALAGIMTEQLTVQREMASHLVKAVAYLDTLSKQPAMAAKTQSTPSATATPATEVAAAPSAPVELKRKQNW